MKEESVLNILMYLFQNHMDDSCKLDTAQAHLWPELEEVGFEHRSIGQAFDWLNKLKAAKSTIANIDSCAVGFRVYTNEEMFILDTECRGFLLFLEQQGILNPQTRELVVNQVLELEDEGIDTSLIKWVTLMVLFNQPDQKEALTCMEFLVLEEVEGTLN